MPPQFPRNQPQRPSYFKSLLISCIFHPSPPSPATSAISAVSTVANYLRQQLLHDPLWQVNEFRANFIILLTSLLKVIDIFSTSPVILCACACVCVCYVSNNCPAVEPRSVNRRWLVVFCSSSVSGGVSLIKISPENSVKAHTYTHERDKQLCTLWACVRAFKEC